MKRNFLFIIPDLNYQKSDLNVKESPPRFIIGQLARMITNTLFLSHSLRKDILILIFVLIPKPHLYKISSDTIRYLGPELRSSASIFLKAEKILEDEKLISDKWFEPNPGLYVKLTNLPLINYEENLHFILIEAIQNSESQQMTLQNFDDFITNNYSNDITKTFFVISLLEDIPAIQTLKQIFQEKNYIKINLVNNIPLPNIPTIINLILDKIEEN